VKSLWRAIKNSPRVSRKRSIGETSKLRVKYDDAFKQVGKTIEEELKAMKQDIEDINNIKSKHLEVILEKLRSESEESIKLLKVQYREEMQNVERQVAKGIVDQEQKLNKDFSAMLASHSGHRRFNKLQPSGTA